MTANGVVMLLYLNGCGKPEGAKDFGYAIFLSFKLPQMKKLLFLIAITISIPNSLFSQIKSFWGIPFESSKDSVVSIVLRNHKYSLSNMNFSKFSVLICEDCYFAGNKSNITIYYNNSGVFAGYVEVINDNQNKILNLYKSIKEDLEVKYGNPTHQCERYKSPFYKGDGHEILAIKTGYSTIGSTWNFIDNSSITLSVDDVKNVQIWYTDGNVYPETMDDLDKKKMNDY